MNDENNPKRQLMGELETSRCRPAALQVSQSYYKRREGTLPIIHRFLKITNRSLDMTSLLEEFVSAVKVFTGCGAAGIRVLDREGNIPYQAYKGFSQRFYELESPLSIKSDQCLCINVIKGKTQAKLPYYTKGGSFHTNGTTRLLATLSEKDKGRTRNVCNEFGYESVALVPIRLGDRNLGLIHVADPQENKIPLKVVEVLEEVAMELGTAIRRVRAEEKLRESEERYRALLHLDAEVGEAVIMLQDTEQGEAIQTFVSGQWSRITGYSKDELLSKSFFDLVSPKDRRASIERHQRKMRGEAMPGLFEMSIIKKDGTEVPIELTSAFTTFKKKRVNVAYIRDITERKRTEKELRRSESRLRLLSQRAINAQEEERTRIARELHDELGQELAAIKIEAVSLAERLGNSSVAERAWTLVNLADQLISTVHRTSVNLRPEMLDKLGLVKAAQWYAEDFEQHTGISCPIDVEGQVIVNSKEAATAAYRILQEVLTNVLRHAKATQAEIRISKKGNKLVINVSDNGVGMDMSKLDDKSSLGLLGMRERAYVIGGTLRIRSRLGKGTNVTACIPL